MSYPVFEHSLAVTTTPTPESHYESHEDVKFKVVTVTFGAFGSCLLIGMVFMLYHPCRRRFRKFRDGLPQPRCQPRFTEQMERGTSFTRIGASMWELSRIAQRHSGFGPAEGSDSTSYASASNDNVTVGSREYDGVEMRKMQSTVSLLPDTYKVVYFKEREKVYVSPRVADRFRKAKGATRPVVKHSSLREVQHLPLPGPDDFREHERKFQLQRVQSAQPGIDIIGPITDDSISTSSSCNHLSPDSSINAMRLRAASFGARAPNSGPHLKPAKSDLHISEAARENRGFQKMSRSWNNVMDCTLRRMSKEDRVRFLSIEKIKNDVYRKKYELFLLEKRRRDRQHIINEKRKLQQQSSLQMHMRTGSLKRHVGHNQQRLVQFHHGPGSKDDTEGKHTIMLLNALRIPLNRGFLN